MSIKLISGSYPQINDKFATLNGTWDERDLATHGHTLMELRLQEMTLKSEGKTLPYDKLKAESMSSELYAISGTMIESTQRCSIQLKTTMRFDMSRTTCYLVEKAARAEMMHNGRRNAEQVDIIVETMITKYDGHICHWGRIDKGLGEGIRMILAYVDGKHVGRMSSKERAAAMEFTWDEEVCDISLKNVPTIRQQIVCGYSGNNITQ